MRIDKTGELITLIYNPGETKTQTVNQKPDNVLELEKRERKYLTSMSLMQNIVLRKNLKTHFIRILIIIRGRKLMISIRCIDIEIPLFMRIILIVTFIFWFTP